MSDRTEYVAGLRILADLLERHDDLPLPTHGDVSWLLFGTKGERDTAAQIVRRMPGIWTKVPYGDEGKETLFGFIAEQRGVSLKVVVYRDAVCERIVTGTERVTETIPDPAVQVPLVEVTREVETVEWRCSPLLAEATRDGAS